MSIPVLDTRITIFDEQEHCTILGCSVVDPGHPADAEWFEARVEDAAHGGIGASTWIRGLRETDEGVRWIRGWHHADSPQAVALAAAWLLNRSAT